MFKCVINSFLEIISFVPLNNESLMKKEVKREVEVGILAR